MAWTQSHHSNDWRVTPDLTMLDAYRSDGPLWAAGFVSSAHGRGTARRRAIDSPFLFHNLPLGNSGNDD